MYLIDTNIISAGAPSKRGAPAGLIAWMEQASDYLFLSVVTAAEVENGISKAFRERGRTKAKNLIEWWAAIEHIYGNRILPVDLDVAHAAGKLLDKARSKGHSPDFADVAIAATAWVHNLTILTHNVRHFEPLGISLLNPSEQLPPLPGTGLLP